MTDTYVLLKQAVMQVAAGGLSGFVEVSIMHPLDLVKTRLQMQTTCLNKSKSDPYYYSGIVDCFVKIIRHEGFISLYKGIIPAILAETPKKAVKFVAFEQYKNLFLFANERPPLSVLAFAGFCAGVSEAIVVNPFEVVKITLQSNKADAGQTPSTWAVTRQIVREHGIGTRGLYKGVTATMARNGVFNLFYFGFYHTVMGKLPEIKDPYLAFGRRVLIGFASATLGAMMNMPFDVAKSRIQGPQPKSGANKYKTCTEAIAIVGREEGYRALYKGLLARVLRLGPGGAIVLLVYESSYDFLQEKFK